MNDAHIIELGKASIRIEMEGLEELASQIGRALRRR